jgi:two-component SAPR family response regulator
MTKRKIDTFEEALKDFALLFKKEAKEQIKFWSEHDIKRAEAHESAFNNCLYQLKTALEDNGLELDEIGLGGYEVPKAKDEKNA